MRDFVLSLLLSFLAVFSRTSCSRARSSLVHVGSLSFGHDNRRVPGRGGRRGVWRLSETLAAAATEKLAHSAAKPAPPPNPPRAPWLLVLGATPVFFPPVAREPPA